MNVLDLKEMIKDLPDDMKVEVVVALDTGHRWPLLYKSELGWDCWSIQNKPTQPAVLLLGRYEE